LSQEKSSGDDTPVYHFSNDPDERCVQLLQEYLKIKTAHPQPDYSGAIKFLEYVANMYNLPFDVYEVDPGKPIGQILIKGASNTLPSIVLLSHTDVVPVEDSNWMYPPFSGYMDSSGNIYGRGAQDMKSVGIQYVEALHRLVVAGNTFQRDIYVLYVPDEEIAGISASILADTQRWKDMNVGFVLDEGLASENDVYTVFYGQRTGFRTKMEFVGATGHGSRFIENAAISQATAVLDQALAYRAAQEQKMIENNLTLGLVTTLNPTVFQAGVLHDGKYSENVVPSTAMLVFDIRVTPSDTTGMPELIMSWAKSVYNCTVTPNPSLTVVIPQVNITENVWWPVITSALESMNATYIADIFSAGSDGRFFLQRNYTVLGFSPLINTPVLLHDHNEFVNNKTLLNGVRIYEKIILNLANFVV